MSYKANTGMYENVTLPTVTDGDLSQSFIVPKGAKVCTLHLPDLIGAGTTVKFQTLPPPDSDFIAEVWTDLETVVVASPITFALVQGFIELHTYSIPVTVLGGGGTNLRLKTSAAQTGAPNVLTAKVSWGFDG